MSKMTLPSHRLSMSRTTRVSDQAYAYLMTLNKLVDIPELLLAQEICRTLSGDPDFREATERVVA